MKRIILTSFILLSFAGLHAQTTADRIEVSSAGADATTSTGANVSYTVGGLVVETSSTPSMDITQGFEQPTDDSEGTFTSVKPPNAFSPDGDGVNDFWIIDLPENLLDIVDLTIVNRWGDQIAFIEDYNNTTNVWDGTYDSSGDPVVSGTYFFIMEARELGGKKTGWIQVVRNN
ncbi:MAG: gliding motility-associated C-terminal domain-containing protein [Flavobacteriales bacterium]|nr:gliding motility-associated C-terminal domain-containing protein [Flavobacteriales bacterium]